MRPRHVTAGGVCAIIGIGISAQFGDVPAALSVYGTAGSAAAGIAGAVLVRLMRQC